MADSDVSSGLPPQWLSSPSSNARLSMHPNQADTASNIVGLGGAPKDDKDIPSKELSPGKEFQASRVKSDFDELVQSETVLERMNSLPKLSSFKFKTERSQTTAEEPSRADSFGGVRTPISAPAPATPGTDGKLTGPFAATPTHGNASGRLGGAIGGWNKTDPFVYLREAASKFQALPSIFKRACVTGCEVSVDDKSGCTSESSERQEPVGISVPGWPGDPTYNKPEVNSQSSSDIFNLSKAAEQGGRQSVHKVARQKGVSSGRTYTSKYRGVHQTFPTRRWEAQFRRNGKPTSLGCFDREEEAARAYDRMMVWCDLHGQDIRGSSKGSSNKANGLSLNFDYSEYEDDFEALQHITQDELVLELRRQGRLQAATNNAVLAERPPAAATTGTKRKAIAMES